MVMAPSFTIESLAGLLGSSINTPFLLCGFVQYFSNMSSLLHTCRDRWRDSAKTPLFPEQQRQQGRQLSGRGKGW